MVEFTHRVGVQIPEPDYDDPKELYAFFGLAAYCVQLLEQGLLNLVVGLRILTKQGPTWDDVRRLYAESDRKTMGQLLKAIRELAPFDPSLEDQLVEALDRRNYIIHHFFVEHSESLLSPIGKRLMIDELRQAIALLKAVDLKIDDLWLTIWSNYGFTKERIERELQEAKRALNFLG